MKRSRFGYHGVYRRRTDSKFLARIGKQHERIGLFATAIEAAKAYDAEARRRYGESAVTNFRTEDDGHAKS